jgi:hypothetical protein
MPGSLAISKRRLLAPKCVTEVRTEFEAMLNAVVHSASIVHQLDRTAAHSAQNRNWHLYGTFTVLFIFYFNAFYFNASTISLPGTAIQNFA